MGGARGLGGMFSPAGVGVLIALLISFLALFWQWFDIQHQFSWGNPDWSHAYLIPVISAYVIWRRREQVNQIPLTTFWPGMLPILVGIACYFYFTLGFGNHMFRGFALVLTLFGAVLLLAGPRMTVVLAFPIAYLAFGVTIAEMVMNKLTFQLQLVASYGSWVLLQALSPILQAQTELSGNTLFITTNTGREIPLNVAEACSGMRMLVAFYALGVVVAFLSCKHWWQRVALILAAGPVAVFVNVLRVAFLGIASLFDRNLAAGEAHTMIGVLWLVPAFLLFSAIVWALNRIVHEPGEGDAKGAGA